MPDSTCRCGGQDLRVAVDGAELVGRRPGRAVDRAVLPPRPDLFGDVGQERRQQPQLSRQGEDEGGPGRRVAAFGPVLDQLEVVVAEVPEELLGDLESRRVVVPVEVPGGLLDTPRRRVSSARSSGSVTSDGSSSDASAPSPYCSGAARTNFDAFSTFMDSRRPTFICVSSKGESAPGRASAARQRTASAPYLSMISSGTTTLPLDLLIFLRSGSTTKPDRAAWLHGTVTELEVRSDDGAEQPGADDVVALGPQVHRVRALEQVGVALPAGDDLRSQRGRGPGVEDVRDPR